MNYKEFLEKVKEYQKYTKYVIYDLALSVVSRNTIDSPETIAGVYILLLRWNIKRYYGKGSSEFEKEIARFKELLTKYKYCIHALRKLGKFENINFDAELPEMNKKIKDIIIELFDEFSNVLGSTGASKALHLLIPNIFIMWDTKIREYYKLGDSASDYLQFLKTMQRVLNDILRSYMQEHNVGKEQALKQLLSIAYGDKTRPITKLLDEYNWIICKQSCK